MHDEPAPPPPEVEAAEDDIGSHAANITSADDPSERELESDKDILLLLIRQRIGSKQVAASQLSFVPSWLLDEAVEEELAQNWQGAYELVGINSLPPDANVIASHVVFKVKDNQDGSLRLKARLVLHGNRDKDRFKVRRDSASAELFIVRVLLSISAILGFKIATADVKGAYMQSGGISRDIFVSTFKPIEARRGQLWKLLRLPYCIFEAGRQWLCSVEELDEEGLQAHSGIWWYSAILRARR